MGKENNLKGIIKNSGHNLHMQVVEILEDAGWRVNSNSYYYDDSANKPREIDIIASKEEKIIEPISGIKHDEFTIFLFIECKYFNDPIIFRLHNQTETESWHSIITKGLNKYEIFDNTRHSFLRLDRVGKLHDTTKKQEKNLFDAVTQPIKSLLFFKDADSQSKAIYLPLVVFNGPAEIYYAENQTIKEYPEKIAYFGINYWYKNVHSNKLEQQYFVITFVKLKYLTDFLNALKDNEVVWIRKHLEFKANFGPPKTSIHPLNSFE